MASRKKPEKYESSHLHNEFWERQYSPSVREDSDSEMGAYLNPMNANDHVKTYMPVNVEDH